MKDISMMNRFRSLLGLCLSVVLLAPIGASATPNIQTWHTSNGAQVVFVEAPELPMVDIRLVFDAAASRDGERLGVATMTAGMLDDGAGKLNSDQIAEGFARVGAQFGASAHRDMAVVTLRSLTQDDMLQPALSLFTTVLSKPTFPKEDFERERKRRLVGIQAKKQSPETLASDAFFHALYGDHAYAKESSGTEDSISALQRKHLVEHHKRYYVARNAIVAIVGALDRKQAEAISEQIMKPLPAGDKAKPLANAAALTEANTVRLNYPSSQSHLLLGQPSLSRNDPDYFPLYVGNHILGGNGLVSRISDEVREKRGLSYSAYSYFSPMRYLGPFQMGLQTRNDQLDEALQVLRQTLIDFRNDGPTEDELTAAKQNLTGGFALQLDSNSKIVDYVAMIAFYELPLDYLDTLMAKIDAVTVDQIKDAFQRRIDPDKLVTVIVGGHSNSPNASAGND